LYFYNSGAISGEIKTSLPTIECHPLVLFSILDSYNRRPTGTKSVIGTLLGVTSTRTVDLNGSLSTSEVVTVTNAFTVPHEVFSNDSLAIGKDFNRQMLELHLRVNPKESIVGWFSTTTEDGKFVVETTSAIHQFYSEEVSSLPTKLLNMTLNQPNPPTPPFFFRPPKAATLSSSRTTKPFTWSLTHP